ncbi:uncharacterized protein METZ01_LOCUS224631 [marine metagenome]|uniref:Uncharacterized protein n=1 Tax=marine metagenome TaxID=408172 RepID=A0A382GB19_9ZZZZ
MKFSKHFWMIALILLMLNLIVWADLFNQTPKPKIIYTGTLI